MVKSEPDTLFVFGDNLARWGFGGQAKEMRGAPNAVGIPTKVSPSIFLNEKDLSFWLKGAFPDMARLINHVGPIVWPSSGIGTGLANLSEHSPTIYKIIKGLEKFLNERIWP